ncbi:DUF602-domain-containing protein [Trichodelitschia bisporula]|uniref:DUF602-domain-containing protein n=1 Tax=Trichodelitschia bisporula TaxID=703511 RepID=A0A6G1HQP5_9PEZI|nr:DUF602-domain-containing protein [Trichodelitschia bisporula]
MGNDGGSIPKRRELVKEAARNPTTAELKESQQTQQEYFWTTDPLNNAPLRAPIVSDCTGRLFNKDSIIETLLPSDDAEGEARKVEAEKVLRGTVKSLKDVVEVLFEVDGEAEKERDGAPVWVCPVTGKRLGPGSKAVYLVPCGHAFDSAAIKEVAGEKCLQCNEPYAPNDVIPIVPVVETDIARLMLRIKTLKEKGLTHSLKKAAGSKKRKKNSDAAADKPKATNADDEAPSLVPAPAKEVQTDKATANIKNVSAATVAAKVLEEQAEQNKRRKTERNQNLSSLFSSRDQKPKARHNDFMNRGYTLDR